MFATVEACHQLGIKWLTFFVFSTENWKRDYAEIQYLVGGDNSLLYRIATRRAHEMYARNIRFKLMGERSKGVADNALAAVYETEQLTRNNTGLTLVIAVDYGGRQELVRAASLAAKAGANGWSDSPESFKQFLYIPEMPDIDLLIRTSGERRISNYMLWQMAYAELIFVDVLWPEFNRSHLDQCLSAFSATERRFGR